MTERKAVSPTGKQLYSMVTSRFQGGSFPWPMVKESGKKAWTDAAAELLLKADSPAAAVADAQPLAWPIANAENAAIGWTLDFKFVEQVRETAAMGYGFSAGQEEAEAILMAALSVHPLYAAPQSSGNTGPLAAVERQAIVALLDLAYAAYIAAEDSVEDDNPDFIHVDKKASETLNDALDAVEALPDDCPGYALGGSAPAKWALRRLFGCTTMAELDAAIAASKEGAAS